MDDGLFAAIAPQVEAKLQQVDRELGDLLQEMRDRGYRNGATGAECARLSDCAAEDVPRLVAAIGRVMALTHSRTNPELGGVFLEAVGIQVRQAILDELQVSEPVGR